ncbi:MULTISPECIES: helix-turn-helix domain-containing protein [Niastella]|uniref:AraC family transcriptional regulator n=1 Tax=Niastella soli TaxID=2821487 RepID=A0ABS3YZR0_9BACT|nr:helix-turn-helix domain-containing protein [Niastella soli]MBO9203405.1 AraC family transcriptional regulator [Niastella soli]
MTYYEIKPGQLLQQYIKCYYVYESSSTVAFEDTVFPSGCMEIIFNLGAGNWQTQPGDEFITHPPIELWGQLNRPLPVRSVGSNTMLGVRFYPHAVASFLPEKVSLFNNQVIDYRDVSGKAVSTLHAQLQETRSWSKRVTLLEAYLLKQIEQAGKRLGKVDVVKDLMYELRHQDVYKTMETIATRYGISARYMQQLFLQYTGLTPKLYNQINRFQHSLRLVTARSTSLTDIAYECGYADQSHFIKEFKAFTGTTPSGYSINNSPVTLATHQQEEASPLLAY